MRQSLVPGRERGGKIHGSRNRPRAFLLLGGMHAGSDYLAEVNAAVGQFRVEAKAERIGQLRRNIDEAHKAAGLGVGKSGIMGGRTGRRLVDGQGLPGLQVHRAEDAVDGLFWVKEVAERRNATEMAATNGSGLVDKPAEWRRRVAQLPRPGQFRGQGLRQLCD